MKTYLAVLLCLVAALRAAAQAPFPINNLVDRTVYNDARTFSVPITAGYSYGVYLNGTNFFAGGNYTVRHPDFYILQASRTNNTSGAVTNQYLRFIIMDNLNRGDTERGLPTHTPLIAIPSSSNELAGGSLRLIVPAAFPVGYEIPVVAWAVNDQGKALRANGWLEAQGHPSIFLRRGAGSGFLGSNNPAGPLNYTPRLKGIQTNKTINLESGTTWTTVSGTLSGSINWPANSRIHVTGTLTLAAGSTLTIGAGSIIRVNAGIDINHNGTAIMNGTLDNPIIFMPNSRTEYWGGFITQTTGGNITATATIFIGSGANQDWYGTIGPDSHRDEQALMHVGGNQTITLTDCAQIYSAGQFSHSGSGGTFTLTRFLIHKSTSAGEFTGATFRVNDSAFIEVPDDSSNFVNLDNDAIYLVNGNHGFTNTVFGWTKDDGIDSGAGGGGNIYYESCWFESIFHDANALSGTKNVFPRNTVYIDCGQGHESGYDAPNGFVENCLFLANKSGVRHGDNYTTMSGYEGRLSATNSILLFNHRDAFGYNWDSQGGWTNSSRLLTIRGNWFTKPDTNFPDNAIWNPADDGWRLGAFSTAAGDADVGVGMALRAPQVTIPQLTNGVPVRLSTFSTNFVSVDYAIETETTVLASGTLQFVPGEIVKYIRITPPQSQNQSLIRVHLSNPVRAEITANPYAFYSATPTPPQRVEWRNFRGDWYLFWADPTFRLQEAHTITGEWTTLPSPSPTAVDLSGTSRFYRLVR